MEYLENAGGRYDDVINEYLDTNKDNQFNLETTAIAASRVFAIPQNGDALALVKNNTAIAKMWDIFQKSNELQKATIDQIIEVQKASHAFIQIINKREMLQAAAIITVKNQLNTLNIENKEIYETIKKLAGNVLERFTQLERKIEHVEAVASITQWIQNLKWRKYDEDPHTKRFFRILDDFYVNSGKNFTLQNLESLKTALDQSSIDPFDTTSIEDFTTTLVDELIEHDFNESMKHSPYNAKYSFDDVNDKISLPFLSSLYLISEEYNHLTKRRYAIDKIRTDVKQAALCYLKKDCGIDVSAELEYYYLGIELLNGRRLIEFLDSPVAAVTERSSTQSFPSDSPFEIDTSQERYKEYMDIIVTFLNDRESLGMIDDEERELLKMKQIILKLTDEEAKRIEESTIGNHQNKDEAENKYREEVRKTLGNNPEITAKKRMRLDLSAQSFGISPDVAKKIETEAIELINTNTSDKVKAYRKLVREKLDEAYEVSPKARIYLDLKIEELGLNKESADKAEKEELASFQAKAEQDETLAVELLRKAAEHGDKEAQYNLAICYNDGTGIAKDETEALGWLHKAAEQGYAEAQNRFGVCYRDGIGVSEDEREAVKWFHKAAEQGYAMAQYNLGNCYYSGTGVTKDKMEATGWYRKAAEQGEVNSQLMLAQISTDETESVNYLHKAAEQGNAEAQNQLGFYYSIGFGVEENEAESVKWYRKAAIQGNAEAQKSLGDHFFIDGDNAQAEIWYRKAAEQGDPHAQLAMGDMKLGSSNEYSFEAKRWYQMVLEKCQGLKSNFSWWVDWGFLSDDIFIQNESNEKWNGDFILEIEIKKEGHIVFYKLFSLPELDSGEIYRYKSIMSISGASNENTTRLANLFRLNSEISTAPQSKKCNKCQTIVPFEAIFCPECGNKL